MKIIFITKYFPDRKMKSMPTPAGYSNISLYQSACTLPDAAVVFKGAGGLLTFQTQLDCTWIIFFLKNQRSYNV